ncbi:hypothetical protein KKG71_02215 [Patescibacteria group bacterium]|nr:hypothetical protein [Patescibacteria group bacterium]
MLTKIYNKIRINRSLKQRSQINTKAQIIATSQVRRMSLYTKLKTI